MLNKWTGIGYVGGSVELRYTADGKPVANFNLATSESYKGKDGNRVDNTTWHRIVLWGKLAETANQYVHKGSLLYIEGRLDIREYEAKDGRKVKTHEIVANTMKMLSGKGEGGSSSQGGQQRKPSSVKDSGDDDGTFVHEEDDVEMPV